MKARYVLFSLTTVSFCFAAFSQQSEANQCPDIPTVSHISCTKKPDGTCSYTHVPAPWDVEFFKEGDSGPIDPDNIDKELSDYFLTLTDAENSYPCGISNDTTKPPEIFHVTSFTCIYHIRDTEKNTLDLTLQKSSEIYIKTSESKYGWPNLSQLHNGAPRYYLEVGISCTFDEQNCFQRFTSNPYSTCPSLNSKKK